MKKIGIIGIILFLTIGLFAWQNETRILNLKIVADQGYRNQAPSWKAETISFIALASKTLDNQVKIQMQIAEFDNWERTSSRDVDYYLLKEEIVKAFPRNNTDFDVLIALTSHHLDLNFSALC